MNKEHKIHHNTSASNFFERKILLENQQKLHYLQNIYCNNVILFVMLDKNQFVGIFWQQCR